MSPFPHEGGGWDILTHPLGASAAAEAAADWE